MRESIFSGLSLSYREGRFDIRYPNRIHAAAAARRIATRHGLEIVDAADQTWRLTYAAATPSCPGALKRFFAELNGFPAPYPTAPLEAAPIARSADRAGPLVSCIIVVNENAGFVQEQLLPSLLANSADFPIEIVLVHNGSRAEFPAITGMRQIRTEWGAVATAYNAGARESRGTYLAFFHDDCIIDDAGWIRACLAALEGGVNAVAGEFRRMTDVSGAEVPALPIAKSVPLFLRRRDFDAVGGYDEFHYVGYEDLDFTLALMTRGLTLAPVEVALRHFNGMSSTLKYCPLEGLDSLYALTAMPRGAIRQRFKEFVALGILEDGIDVLRLALDVQLLYVLKKHRTFLATMDNKAFAQATAALERKVTRQSPMDATLIVPYFRTLDRRLAAQAGPGAAT